MPTLALDREIPELSMQGQAFVRFSGAVQVGTQSVIPLDERSVVQASHVHTLDATWSGVRHRG
jgi:hypothetical protein